MSSSKINFTAMTCIDCAFYPNLLAENGIFDKGLKFRSMILPDVFIDQDTPERMYDVAGLNAKHIAQKVLEVFFSKDGIRVIK